MRDLRGGGRHVLKLKNRYRIGANIGGDKLLLIGRAGDHMAHVLPRTHHPVDLVGRGIIAGDQTIRLGREIKLSAKK